ncbi:helix-turn-helix domain-containing protein [Streptomyces sp. NBC_00385]|uniref:helix-turn-helix domain-containing protein n=1 Tax=Streptomyces sp. NBC_00385 TaxID=2975733 RepID=UPI002DDA1D39|nr:helix-turn-helix domain-containing protein [Streptomyces sp. NBC_00385]WRZ05067.1 hypothetical protein OG959_17770 [Streptomyces sp. NBC_00385]
MTGALTLAQRRAKVRQMAQEGISNRAIAAQVGVGKDTVARILAAPIETRAEALAYRVAQVETAVAALSAAAQAALGADPAHTITDDETARRWWTELRATAAQLLAHADQFADYYPGATETGGAP